MAMFIGNHAHVRRIQFIAFIFLLIPFYKSLYENRLRPKRRLIFGAIMVFSILSTLWTVNHSSDKFDGHIPIRMRELIENIEAMPSHESARIFMVDKSILRLMPFVRFFGFVGNIHGKYYSEDPVSSERLYSAYHILLAMKPNWREAMAQNNAKHMIFAHGSSELESELKIFYMQFGEIVFENAEWTIIEVKKE